MTTVDHNATHVKNYNLLIIYKKIYQLSQILLSK